MRPARLAAGAAVLAAAALAPAAFAADAPPQAALCTTCHGKDGLSVTPDAPHLAGQPAIYLAAQLRNFRSGKRPHEVMAVIAKSLSDDDIRALAAWYSAIRVEARLP